MTETIQAQYNLTTQESCRWIARGETVEVQGMTLTRGCFYLGQEIRLPDYYYRTFLRIYNFQFSFDHDKMSSPLAVVDPACSVDLEEDEDYVFETYEEMSHRQRKTYLSWLSGDLSLKHLPTELLLFYIYGLEIRMFTDYFTKKTDRREILELMIELWRAYIQLFPRGRTAVIKLCARFIEHATVSYFYRDKETLLTPEEIAQFQMFKLVDLEAALAGKRAISNKFALELAEQLFDFDQLAPEILRDFIKVSYCEYFLRDHPRGLRVAHHGVGKNFHYTLQSKPLQDSNFVPFTLFPLTAHTFGTNVRLSYLYKQLEQPYKILVSEFKEYNGIRAMNGGKESILALFALPASCNFSETEMAKSIQKDINKTLDTQPYFFINTSVLFEQLGYRRANETKPKKHYSDILVDTFLRWGYGVVPNYQVSNERLSFKETFVLYKKTTNEPAAWQEVYSILIPVLRLVVDFMVRLKIRHPSRSENLLVRQMLLRGVKTDQDLDYLMGYYFWLLSNSKRLTGLMKKGLQQDDFILSREWSTQLLIRLCYKGHELLGDRVKVLKKMMPLLGQQTEEVHTLIHRYLTEGAKEDFCPDSEDQSSATLLVQRTSPDEVNFATREARPTAKFDLNFKKITQLEAKTKESQALLAHIFDASDALDAPNNLNNPDVHLVSEVSKAANEEASHQPSDKDRMAQNMLHLLLQKSVWDKKEVEALCKEQGYMLGSVLEAINDYAYRIVEDTVVDDEGDTLYVTTEYKKELE